MAVMKPDLLLTQYHPRSLVSFEASVIESRMVERNTFSEQLITVTSTLGIMKVYPTGRRYFFSRVVLFKKRPLGWGNDCPGHPTGPRAPRNSDPSAMISGIDPTGEQPLFLSTDLPRVEGPSRDEELVDTFSESEPLDDLSEEREDIPPKKELVLVEPTSTTDFEELTVEQGLPWVLSTNNSSGDLMRRVDLVFIILRTWNHISHGYETFCSMLRMLGVDEYSQLDHEGVSGSKIGTA
ncbi:LOW QUALITY PROTEIN: hypothetical protein Cgig2_013485 [Carnegiea gigantea]|uniref:Uncharacterized protein n=1 Tax=Carnegiea gigantea TaxID=171969 RepID=A0A9Q1GN41_9CARY|nr:LOW QUALITY PROTEIN: hypothetical protein Cgig2_013485 [Carnegiea gigantea]